MKLSEEEFSVIAKCYSILKEKFPKKNKFSLFCNDNPDVPRFIYVNDEMIILGKTNNSI